MLSLSTERAAVFLKQWPLSSATEDDAVEGQLLALRLGLEVGDNLLRLLGSLDCADGGAACGSEFAASACAL